MLTLGRIIAVLGLTLAGALTVYGCCAASRMMRMEREREALRRAMEAAMRTDRHLDKLRGQRMRVRYHNLMD